LITTRPNLVVQPLETSVIREIHVRAGDVVNRGDVLATLDPTFSQADLDQLRDTRGGNFDAMINRLMAEIGPLRLCGGGSRQSGPPFLQGKMFPSAPDVP